MQPNDQELAMVLQGGLRGRFQNSFHLLENAFEVLNDQMLHCVTPQQYETLQPLLAQIGEQLLLLRRLGEHAADAAVAPVLRQVCVPRPMELLGQLREWCNLFNEIALQEQVSAVAQLETPDDMQVLLTMGDDILLEGLLSNLFSNSLAADHQVHITLACAPGIFCYQDDGPGLSADAKALLNQGIWSSALLDQGGLGLPLIRAYASAMGWTLSAEEGAGTRLRFALPPCTMDTGTVIFESGAVQQQLRYQRKGDLQRELYPALHRSEEDAHES